MSYFTLPTNNNLFNIDDLYIKTSNNISNIEKNILSSVLSNKVITFKHKIDDHKSEWDYYKKFTNPYEFIHSYIPGINKSVAKYKPISRAYYKFIELINTYKLLNNFNIINSFHLAEGPGGFIEALASTRNNIEDKYIGITLLSNSNDIPGWKKTNNLFDKYKNIFIEKGKLKDGDILNKENFISCYNKYKNSMNIITADGGFDFSINFNTQEEISTKLIFVEILYAITLQSYNGHFILKMFDCYTNVSYKIIYFLTFFYNKVSISKPCTSRYANSEKYIVCKNFKYTSSDFLYEKIIKVFNYITNKKYITDIISINIPLYYIIKINEINNILAQQQIDTITNTIKLINNKCYNKQNELKIKYIEKCIYWCKINNVNYNTNLI